MITAIPDNVTQALLQAANSQSADITAQGNVTAAQTALTAAQQGVTSAQQAETDAHTQATNDGNAAVQAVTTWLQSLANPAPVTPTPAPAPASDPPVVADPNATPAAVVA